MHIGHKLATSYFISKQPKLRADWHGVILTDVLKAGKQSRESARKATNVLRTINRHFTLEYSIYEWSPCLRKDINCLEQVQRRATKLVAGLKRMKYINHLNELGLTTMEKR